MKKVTFILIVLTFSFLQLVAQDNFILKAENYKIYIDEFNADDNENYKGYYSNDSAWSFLKSNIPLLDCPDKNLELTYYFRWWTYRKHIKQTPEGFVVSEFLPEVSWSGKYNTISCAAAHHIYEGRWLKDKKYINDYALFWLRKGGAARLYSFWIADALWADFQVKQDTAFILGVVPDLIENYQKWEVGWRNSGAFFTGKNPDGLYSTIDDRDGMEMSIGGSGKRPTINSYMYGDAKAIAAIMHLKGNDSLEKVYTEKADTLKSVVINKLWDKQGSFFKSLAFDGRSKKYMTELVNVREILGYTPWYFNLPTNNKGYEKAWGFLMSNTGFNAPYGLTTAEQSHPKFQIDYSNHECQWNGPSWPFSTSITLTAMANLLNNYKQTVINPDNYFAQLLIYANAQRRINEKGKLVPWIDEVLNPFTGDWISRTMLEGQNSKGVVERGKDYNHSTFCDLIISGLIGLRPQSGNTVIINPLIMQNKWDWFCLDNISYHGKTLTIVFDKYGTKYKKGKGLMCFVDGLLMGRAECIQKISFVLK